MWRDARVGAVFVVTRHHLHAAQVLAAIEYGKHVFVEKPLCLTLDELEAIEAATANGPETLGPQAPHTGQLREGYDADLIALDTNPLEDRSVWGEADRVTHVWQLGRRVK